MQACGKEKVTLRGGEGRKEGRKEGSWEGKGIFHVWGNPLLLSAAGRESNSHKGENTYYSAPGTVQ